MDYSIVVVARDHPRALLRCLLGIRQHARPSSIVLVDNGSETVLDGVVRLSQLSVRALRLSGQASLSRAFNIGLDALDTPVALLLRGDVVLQRDPASAVKLLAQETDVGVVGAKLLSDSLAHARVLHAGYVVERGRLAPAHRGRFDADHFQSAADVDAVSHACMLVRRVDIRFDERFWFRLEDVDLCNQYRARGMRVVFWPALVAIDAESADMREKVDNPRWAVRQLDSQYLYHSRWCSDRPLTDHAHRRAVRGRAASEYLLNVDARFRGLLNGAE